METNKRLVAKYSDGIYKTTIYEETNPGTEDFKARIFAQQISTEDAAFIVKACNAHDELVKALSDCLEEINQLNRKVGNLHFTEVERLAKIVLNKVTDTPIK